MFSFCGRYVLLIGKHIAETIYCTNLLHSKFKKETDEDIKCITYSPNTSNNSKNALHSVKYNIDFKWCL